jgi:hypothetical protein
MLARLNSLLAVTVSIHRMARRSNHRTTGTRLRRNRVIRFRKVATIAS